MGANMPRICREIPKIKNDEVLVMKVGSEERPATDSDIKEVQLELAKGIAMNLGDVDKRLFIVTHHVVDFVVFKKSALPNMIICKQNDV